jgi:hypothetical protein
MTQKKPRIAPRLEKKWKKILGCSDERQAGGGVLS